MLELRDVEGRDEEAHVKLQCRHRFCAGAVPALVVPKGCLLALSHVMCSCGCLGCSVYKEVH